MRLLRSIRFARALRSIRIVRLFRYIGALRTLALSILSTMVGIWGFCFDIKRDLGQVSPNEHTKRIKEKEEKYDPRMFQDLWLVRFLLDWYYLHACMLAESSVYRVLLKITYGLQPLFYRGQWGTMTHAQFDVALSDVCIHCHSVCVLSMVVYINWWYDDTCVSWYCICTSIKNWMGPYQRTPKRVARAIRYSGLGVCSVGPVGDFLEYCTGAFASHTCACACAWMIIWCEPVIAHSWSLHTRFPSLQIQMPHIWRYDKNCMSFAVVCTHIDPFVVWGLPQRCQVSLFWTLALLIILFYSFGVATWMAKI